ncbi:MAG: hypothetical protein U9R02_03600 [Thermodesulfobacteriota bacterium]|nr:hypothetical protein [Thermodesulfobacteriota bacterium]
MLPSDFIEKLICRAPFVAFVANYCFRIITYLDVTPSILFFCIAATTTALNLWADMGLDDVGVAPAGFV